MRFTRNQIPVIFIVMKNTLTRFILIATALLSASCHRNDIRTETFAIDQLRNRKAAQIIAKALHPLPGIQEIRPDVGERTLTVIFDGRPLYLKNIEYEIVHAGFSLPHWPAPEKAKENLPKELR